MDLFAFFTVSTWLPNANELWPNVIKAQLWSSSSHKRVPVKLVAFSIENVFNKQMQHVRYFLLIPLSISIWFIRYAFISGEKSTAHVSLVHLFCLFVPLFFCSKNVIRIQYVQLNNNLSLIHFYCFSVLISFLIVNVYQMKFTFTSQ